MADLKHLALKLATQGPVRTLPTPRLIRLLHNGVYIISTTAAVFVWEHPYYPQLYIPWTHIKPSTSLKIDKGEEIQTDDGKCVARFWTLGVGDRRIDKVVAFEEHVKEVGGLVKIDFASVDQWFEEDCAMIVHPKDPFKRVDILSSTRHIVVRVGGQKVAETDSAMHLYETGLPVRYYLPFTALDASVLRKSDTKTRCPYKGEASYYSVDLGQRKVFEDVVWYYDTPLMESAKVQGLCCFYNEKVEIELDGEKLESPVTPFGSRKPGDKPAI